MRTCVILCCFAGLLTVTSCAHHEPYAPEPPVPAVLSESEAFDLAQSHVDQMAEELSPLRRREMRDWGYIFYYETPYAAEQQPPKTSHIVAVHYDGTIREWLRDEDEE